MILATRGTTLNVDVPPTVFTILGILQVLNNINSKKAYGPDLIPCRILKEAATEIAPFIQLLFTQSLESGSVPSDWLMANITYLLPPYLTDCCSMQDSRTYCFS